MKRLIVFAVGMIVLIALNYAVASAGLETGLRQPQYEANLIAIPALLLVLLPFGLWSQVCWRWGKQPVAGRITAAVVILAVQLPFQYAGTVGFGGSMASAKMAPGPSRE